MHVFQFVVSVAAGWVFTQTIGQDPTLTPQAWALGVLVSGVGTAYVATLVIVWLRDAVQRWTR